MDPTAEDAPTATQDTSPDDAGVDAEEADASGQADVPDDGSPSEDPLSCGQGNPGCPCKADKTCNEGSVCMDDLCVAAEECDDLACSDAGNCFLIEGITTCICNDGFVSLGQDCVPATGTDTCGDVTPAGVCDDDVLTWCSEDGLASLDCSIDGGACAPSGDGFACTWGTFEGGGQNAPDNRFLAMPLADDVYVRNGWQYHPGNGYGIWHHAVDFAAAGSRTLPLGTPVFAPCDGLVSWDVQRANGSGFGRFAMQRCDQKDDQARHDFVILAHLGSVESFVPRVNRHAADYAAWVPVQQGQLIGHSGSDDTSWPHLHFEVFVGSYAESRVQTSLRRDPYDLYKLTTADQDAADFYPPAGESFSGCGTNYLWRECPPVFEAPPFEVVSESGAFWALEDSHRHRIWDWATYEALGSPPVRAVSISELEGWTEARSLDGDDRPILKHPGSIDIWEVQADGTRFAFADEAAFTTCTEFSRCCAAAFEHATTELLAMTTPDLAKSITADQCVPTDCGGDQDCASDHYCSNGSCLPDVCAPQGGDYCQSSQRWHCSANGSSGAFVENCPFGCAGGECQVPDEICNGADDDGDSVIDELEHCWVPVYRFWNPKQPLNERARCYGNTAVTPSGCPGFELEFSGPVFFLYSDAQPGTVGLIAFDMPGLTHILKREDNLADIQALENSGFSRRGVIGYIWSSVNAAPPGTFYRPAAASSPFKRPLHRYSHPTAGCHLYANNPEETAPGWSDEGVRGYVWSSRW